MFAACFALGLVCSSLSMTTASSTEDGAYLLGIGKKCNLKLHLTLTVMYCSEADIAVISQYVRTCMAFNTSSAAECVKSVGIRNC